MGSDRLGQGAGGPINEEPSEEDLDDADAPYQVCSRCDGTGADDPRRFRGTCPRCGGTGIEPEARR